MSNTEIMKRFDFDLQIKYSGDSVIFYAPYRITRRIMRIVQLWGYSYTSIYSHDYENIEYILINKVNRTFTYGMKDKTYRSYEAPEYIKDFRLY